jgi:dihydroorotate dehydrogenase electron transfer subunit
MKCEIISNVFLKDRRLLLEMSVPGHFAAASPGQFLHIRIEDSCDPLLRRPLSIHDCYASRKKNALIVCILYEVVGKGTALLSEKKPFSEIDCLGPLGNGFDLEKIKSCKSVYIVAGGMGVAPLFFLTRKIRELKIPKSKTQIHILLGVKTKNDILREKEFKDLGCEVHVATEDGSKGFKGRVTELLKEKLQSPVTSHQSPATICACGPKPMLAVISEISRRNNIPAQVSLEEFMGCGLGACLGCVIRTTSGYKRICHDGPVFDSSEIIWKD